MKTLKRLLLVVLACLTLTGCAEALGLAIGAATIGGTWLVLDHNSDKNINGTKDTVLESQKQAWIGQCLLNESHTPQWCRARAEEAFSPNTPAITDTAIHEDKKIDKKVIKKSTAKPQRG